MKFLVAVSFLASVAALGADKIVPYGPLKAFKGPEGEVVAMVEVNEAKEMLVHFKNIGGELEGQSRLYLINDMGDGRKDIYFNKKRGSKTHQWNVLVNRNGQWTFYNPTRNVNFPISYSEPESQKWKVEDVLKAYKP